MAVTKAQAAVTATKTVSGSGTLTATLGSTPSVGNLMVALVVFSAGTTATTPPTGWSSVGTPVATSLNISCFDRVVQSGDAAGYTFTVGGISQMYLVEVTGQDKTTPIDASNPKTGTSTAPSTLAVTPTVAGDYVFAALAYFGATTTFAGTPSGGFTSEFNNVGSHSEFLSLANASNGVGAATGDSIATSSAWGGFAVAVKAAAAVPTPRPLNSNVAMLRSSYR